MLCSSIRVFFWKMADATSIAFTSIIIYTWSPGIYVLLLAAFLISDMLLLLLYLGVVYDYLFIYLFLGHVYSRPTVIHLLFYDNRLLGWQYLSFDHFMNFRILVCFSVSLQIYEQLHSPLLFELYDVLTKFRCLVPPHLFDSYSCGDRFFYIGGFCLSVMTRN
jgi:hypothetical protein